MADKSLRFTPSTTDEMRRRASEPGRGRDAAGPFDIPPAGWKDIAARLYVSFFEDRIMLIAAGATFYLLLALFPTFAVFVSAYGYVADPNTIADHIAFIGQFLPQAGTDLLTAQLETLISQDPASLSLTFVTGLLFAMWSANNGVKTLFEAMNVAYGEQEDRSFIKLNAVAFCFTIGGILLATVMLVAVGIIPAVMALVGAQSFTDELVLLGRWPAAFAFIVLAIALIYRFGPSRTRAQWRWVMLGAVLTAAVWLVASIGFSWYLQNFANYGAMYGSLGAVIGFMMWVWISSMIFIVGAEINAEMEHQTARDTTKAGDRPLGARGARVADTIGQSTAKVHEPTPEKRSFIKRKRRRL
ncbi:YihY/virulence factor BrkB family protein [Aureimonas populi]|uniref:YihY/virulence factor BrkB family protein n=1 Tax=Aureimonas populi TaxID=1701758 RepID=A0ABW5CJ95_9HYPH|nr:YihY/virulence factor BrkB family protein [Aureimonas populi]